jgi:sec-independent protein translocase protein TatB
MFDIGFSELLVIAVVALLVLGPERLPKAARFAGLWVRKARAQWYSVKSEFERDLAADELQRSLRETRESLRQAEEELRSGATSIRDQFAKELDDVAAAAVAPVALPHGDAGAPDNADPAVTPAGMTHDAHAGEDDRPLGSSLELDALEPPPPSDEDEAPGTETHDHPPPHHDDAHAGR